MGFAYVAVFLRPDTGEPERSLGTGAELGPLSAEIRRIYRPISADYGRKVRSERSQWV